MAMRLVKDRPDGSRRLISWLTYLAGVGLVLGFWMAIACLAWYEYAGRFSPEVLFLSAATGSFLAIWWTARAALVDMDEV